MAQPARHLHLADPATGEVFDEECPSCLELRAQLAGMEKDIRAWRSRYAGAVADKQKAAKMNPLWAEAIELFRYWQEACDHKRSKWTVDRFELLEPYIREYGPKMCRRAIDGAAYDPFVTRRKNGSRRRHDGIDLIFRSADKFEEMVNRAPRESNGEA